MVMYTKSIAFFAHKNNAETTTEQTTFSVSQREKCTGASSALIFSFAKGKVHWSLLHFNFFVKKKRKRKQSQEHFWPNLKKSPVQTSPIKI